MPCTFRPTMVAGAQRDRILFAFIFLLLCLSDLCCALENNTVKVGVILDLDSWIGRVSKTAIELAVEDMNNDTQLLKGKRLVVDIRDSRNDALYGASAAVDLMKEEMVAIIGPQTSEVAEFVSHLGNAANVPIVSFSVTSSLLSKNRFPYFVPMAHSDAISMKAIAAVVKSYGWRRIVVIYPDNDIDYGGVDSLSDELRDVGSEVEYRAAISATMNRDAMREELYRLNNMQSRIFVVHLNASLGLSLLEEAYAIGMMGVNYVWMTTEAFTDLWNVMLDDSTMAFMQGLLGVKTYRPISYNLDKFNKRWIQKFRAENPHERRIELSEYGVLAYDAVEIIARAIGKLESFHFLKPVWKPSSHPTIAGNSMDVTKIKIFHEGHTLLQEIHNLNFTGLSGPVEVSDKRFLNSVYQILNLVGKSYHVVGYWSNKYKMISRELYSADTWSDQMMVLPKNTSGKLGAVIWPGGSIGVPRGWAIPTIAKRLQIGVPLHKGFREFLSVQNDSSNHSTVSGFSIDVFDAVVRRLDYPLPYDLIPYKIDTFDDFIYQVYVNKFDAAVGDTTILENRSKYVDFSQPFSESGLVMVVPIKKNEANNAWAFLLPFTPGMWCATGGFFIFTGVVVWLLEHKINPRFRGKPSAQLVTLLWFSFSTLFFSHRERIVNSLSRIVVIVWLFVVLILTSSYTASLTSMLTVQQIKPSIASVEFVKARGLPVGYRAGSFVHNYLLDHFRIPEENLKPYSTKKEYAEALSKGPNKGGVAAIIDEIPYMRVFLSKHCGYMMVEPTYRTGGLGFVFPKGSPLLSDISRAVLSLVEDDEMKNIEAKYFDSNLCSTPGPIVGSNRLSMESFWGLYLVTGTVSALALMVFFFRLACNFTRESNDTTEERIECKSVKSFAKYLDRKDSNRQRLAEANSSACSTPYAPQAITFSRDTSSLDSEENLP